MKSDPTPPALSSENGDCWPEIGHQLNLDVPLQAEFWEGDATKQKSVKRSAFSLNVVQAFSE